MPTGYTAKVQNGEIKSLRDFALCCTRAFDFCITMCDDPTNAPIPEQFEPQTKFYDEKIAEAKRKLTELSNLTTNECTRRAIADHANQLDSHREWLAEKETSRKNYEAMIAKITDWEVPDSLTGLHTFMLEQLQESIKCDCSTSYMPDEPKLKTGEQWRNDELLSVSKDLGYALDHVRREIKRTEERNKYLKALRDSLENKE